MQVVEHPGVGRHGGADIDADGCRVDDIDSFDSVGVDLLHMLGQGSFVVGSERGTRLSRTRVLLPEPDTPVTTVSLFRGISVSSA